MTIVLESANVSASGITAGIVGAANTTYVVEQNVHVTADSFGFLSVVSNVGVVNLGGIFGSTNSAVSLGGSGDFLTNGLGASIAGDTGVALNGTGYSVLNLGSIVGLTTGVDDNGSGTLDNRGYLSGGFAGVLEESSLTGGNISNSGTIESPNLGIWGGKSGSPTFILNTGTISGVNDAIEINAGHLSLQNFGKILGGIDSTADEGDTIVSSGTITGDVFLFGGDDTFNGAGGTSGEVFGGDGNDKIVGGRGADRLAGGNGNDTMTGGPGADHFIFSATLNVTTNVDRITDFKHGADKFELDHTIFAAAGAAGTTLAAAAFFKGAHAHDPSDRIIYNPANGFVYYDSNGSGAGHEVHFATLAHNLAVTQADFLIT